MSFLQKVTAAEKSKLISDYLENVVESLNRWVSLVTDGGYQVVAGVDFRIPLQQMNNEINFLRTTLQLLYTAYKTMEDESGVDPLSTAYLTTFSSIAKHIETELKKARAIAYAYNETLKQCESQKFNTEKYLTPKNRKAIDRLFDMTAEELLKILADADLLGF